MGKQLITFNTIRVIIGFLMYIIGTLSFFTYYIPSKNYPCIISKDANQPLIIWILLIGSGIFLYDSLNRLWQKN
jgi:hypothetical protein